MSAALYATKETIVSVSKQYGWEVGRVAIIPAAVLATLHFNKYFILDPVTSLTGVGCAVLINTFVLTVLHIKIQNFWSNYWKDINEKSNKLKEFEDGLAVAIKEYEKACKNLEKAHQDIKKGKRDLEDKTQGKKVAVDKATIHSEGLQKEQGVLEQEKLKAIVALKQEILTLAHYKERFSKKIIETVDRADVDVEADVIYHVNKDSKEVLAEIGLIEDREAIIKGKISDLIIKQKTIELELEIAKEKHLKNEKTLEEAGPIEDELKQIIDNNEAEFLDIKQKKEQSLPSDEAYIAAEIKYQETVERLHFLIHGINLAEPTKKVALDGFQLETLSYNEVKALKEKLETLLKEEKEKRTQLFSNLQPLIQQLMVAIEGELASIENTAKDWLKDLKTRKDKAIPKMKETAEKRQTTFKHPVDGESTLTGDEQKKVNLYFEKLDNICSMCIGVITVNFHVEIERDKKAKPVTFPVAFEGWNPNLSRNTLDLFQSSIPSGIQDECMKVITTLIDRKKELESASAFYEGFMKKSQGNVEEGLNEKNVFIVLDNLFNSEGIVEPYQALKTKKLELYVNLLNFEKIVKRIENVDSVLERKGEVIKQLEEVKKAQEATRDRLKKEYETPLNAYQDICARYNTLDRQIREKKMKMKRLKKEHAMSQENAGSYAKEVERLEKIKRDNEDTLKKDRTTIEENPGRKSKLANELKEVEQIKVLLNILKEWQVKIKAVVNKYSKALTDLNAAKAVLQEKADKVQGKLKADEVKRSSSKKLFDDALIALRNAKTKLRIEKIKTARLELYSMNVEKCKSAQALCDKKKAMLESGYGDLTGYSLEVYQKVALIEELRMNLALERAELSRARHFEKELDASGKADVKTDSDRFNLVNWRLERRRISREQRVLTGNEREEKKTIVLNLFEEEKNLLYKFYSSKIARGKLGIDGELDQDYYTKCSIKSVFAILDLQLEKMIFQGSPRKGLIPMKGSEIITSLIVFFDNENSVERRSVECKAYHDLIAKKIKYEVLHFANIAKALELEKTAHGNNEKFIDFEKLLDALPKSQMSEHWIHLIKAKLILIQQLAVKPKFTDPEFKNTYSEYDNKMKSYRKTKYQFIRAIEEKEEICINKKDLVKIDNKKEENKSWDHKHPVVMGWAEKISFLAPAAILVALYSTGLVPSLSLRAATHTLFIGTISHLFVRTIYPTNVGANTKREPSLLEAASQ